MAHVLPVLAEPIRPRAVAVTVGSLHHLTAVRVELQQVMRNLIANAVQYIGDGRTPAIEVGAADRGTIADGIECG